MKTWGLEVSSVVSEQEERHVVLTILMLCWPCIPGLDMLKLSEAVRAVQGTQLLD